MTVLFQDLRFGIRMLLRNRTFTAVAIAALALGIGANSAVFSVIYGVLLKPLSYHEPERLVRVYDGRRSHQPAAAPRRNPRRLTLWFAETAGSLCFRRV